MTGLLTYTFSNCSVSDLAKDVSDVKLDDYQQTLQALEDRLDSLMKDIQERTDFYNNCDA